MKLIDKDALVAEINRIVDVLERNSGYGIFIEYQKVICEKILSFLDTLEVKEDSLEKFKSLQHISGDLHKTLEDWGYAPNLYYFDGSWHVDWISCEEGDSIKGFTEDTAEEAINKAYNWFHSTFCNS